MRSFFLLAAMCLSGGVLVLPFSAAAQDVAAAEALFNRGVADMEAGKYDTACPAIQESYRIDPRAGTLFTLAECEAQRGRIATAVAHYGDYLGLLERLGPDQRLKHVDRKKTAEQQKAALGPQVPRLTLKLPADAPAGTVVKRDGVELAGPSLGIPLPVDPGDHVISVQPPGGAATEHSVTLARGEQREFLLPVEPVAPAASSQAKSPPVERQVAPRPVPEPDRAPGAGAGRTAVWVTGAVGAAGLIVGGVTGAMTLTKKGVIDDHCDGQKICDHEGKEAADSAQTLGLVSTVGFAVGLAGLTTATVLFLIEPGEPEVASSRAARRPAMRVGFSGNGVFLQGGW